MENLDSVTSAEQVNETYQKYENELHHDFLFVNTTSTNDGTVFFKTGWFFNQLI
jgi:hypothetical protein